MKQMVNGREVDVPMDPDGSIDSDTLREVASVPAKRPLMLQLPDGRNELINPGDRVKVHPLSYFMDMPLHERGWY